ncbi:MAG: PQQ-like beta-propeller repeat protein [Gemmatimonadetes bacterium]|nr:PQQ-like beta-propeller repeat protein [Gemmatimonadota bacterium]
MSVNAFAQGPAGDGEPLRVWSARAGRGAAGPLAVADSVIVVQTTEGRLVAFARASGEKLWTARLAGLGSSGPLVAGDLVYAATARGSVHAVNAGTGRRVWQREVEPVVGPLFLAGERVIAATSPGRVYALNGATGTVVWRQDLETVLHTGPTALDHHLLVASPDSLFLLRLTDGARARAIPAPGLGLNPPVRADSVLVFTSPDGFVAGLHAAGLDRLWRVEVRDGVFGRAVVARDTAFAVTVAGALWRIPLAAPDRADSVALDVAVRAPPTPLEAGVLVATVAGEVLRVSPAGDIVWRVRGDSPIEQAPIVDRGLLVFVDGRGRIHAWR